MNEGNTALSKDFASPFQTWKGTVGDGSTTHSTSLVDAPRALQLISQQEQQQQQHSGPTPLQYPFMRICQLFEKILISVSKAQQYAYLDIFWKSLPRDCSFFPYMRLLIPQLDNVRPMFQLKESKLAKLYVEIMGLSGRSQDAQRLLHWKDPSKSVIETTCFSDVIYVILQHKGGFNRFGQRSAVTSKRERVDGNASSSDNISNNDSSASGFLSVDGVNTALDRLAEAPSTAVRKAILLDLLRRTTALEQKWLLRIILKDMKFRMTHQSILFAFHPNALDMHNSTCDLQYVCDTCLAEMNTPVQGSVASGIFLFQPLRPMLASPVSARRLEQLLACDKIMLEPKYDGERVMIHVDAEKVMYWTRNAKNFSSLYGPKFDDMVRKAFAVGKRCDIPGWTEHHRSSTLSQVTMDNIIIDGELLVFDGAANCFVGFGMNRAFATAGEASLSGGGDVDGVQRWFSFIAFDIVLLNGKSLMHLPLVTRRALMKRVFTEEKNHFEIVRSEQVRTTAEILSGLEQAIADKKEGIILKMGDSPYVPAERKQRWVKIKTDHIAGLADAVDLVVVGGYYGTKFGQRHISHFLLAAWVNGSSATPTDAEALFHTVCKVGNGYTSEELNLINTNLQPHWESMPTRQTIPAWLDGWKPLGSDLTPDVYVHPRNSLVLEVFGYSFTETNNYRVGYTIRFPRMLHIRWDKSLQDATDLCTLAAIRDASQDTIRRKVAEGKDELVTAMALKWRRRRDGVAGKKEGEGGTLVKEEGDNNDGATTALPPRTIAMSDEQLAVATLKSSTEIIDHIFAGYEFCVLFTASQSCRDRGSGSSVDAATVTRSKTSIERFLLQHGAQVVANPGSRTSLLLASTKAAPKVRNWVRMCESKPEQVLKKYAATDVAHCDWALDCVEASTVLPLAPRNMLYSSPSLRAKFDLVLDPFEDHYYEPCTLESLRHSLKLARKAVVKQEEEEEAKVFSAIKRRRTEQGKTSRTQGGDEGAFPGDGHRSLVAVSTSVYEGRHRLGLLPSTAVPIAAISWTLFAPLTGPTEGTATITQLGSIITTTAAAAQSPSLSNAVAAAWLAARPSATMLRLIDEEKQEVEKQRKRRQGQRVAKGEEKKMDMMKRSASSSEIGEATARETTRKAALLPSDSLFRVLPSPQEWTSMQLVTIANYIVEDGCCVVSESAEARIFIDPEGRSWRRDVGA